MKQVFNIDVPAVKALRKIDDGTYQYVVTRPASRSEVVLDIDIDKLVQRLGISATISKTGKTAYLGGLVKVKFIRSLP